MQFSFSHEQKIGMLTDINQPPSEVLKPSIQIVHASHRAWGMHACLHTYFIAASKTLACVQMPITLMNSCHELPAILFLHVQVNKTRQKQSKNKGA
mmetsp:Transcript_117830/g.229122  ORF Transcript_117830/g.229122 Transcript_117830/m.229122 type:complete len:96 (+) Transcript_117830:31-318(+)